MYAASSTWRWASTIALDIETGKSGATASIKKCLDAGCDAMTSAATSGQVSDAIQKEVRQTGSIDRRDAIARKNHIRY